MSWVRIDDGFDSHPKIARLSDAAVALFVRGLAHAGRYLSDGFLDAAWMRERTRGRARKRGLAELVEAGLVELHEDGSARIPDYLDYNRSRAEVEAERQKNREKQRRHRDRPKLFTGKSLDPAYPGDSPVLGESRMGVGEEPPPTGQRHELDARVDQALSILSRCPRLTVDQINTRIGVENAIAAAPDADPVAAAREVATWVSDPAFRKTNPAALLLDAMRKQPKPGTPGGEPLRPGAAAYGKNTGRVVTCPDCDRRHERHEPTRRFPHQIRCDPCYAAHEERLTGVAAE